MKNWKTTLLGVLIILGAVINAAITWLKTGSIPDPSTLYPSILFGWGLIHAADANPSTPPPVSKIASVLIFAVAINMTGCAWVQSHREQIKGTLSVIANRAFAVAGNAVISAAADEVDKNYKANFLDSVASGLRANEANIISSDDIKRIVQIWSPTDGDRWQELATEVARVAGPAPTAATVEQIATGLNNAAAQARASTRS
jgi:hypothetical protein